MIDGRDVTPFPLDDLRMVYAEVRYSKRLGKEKHYAPLRTALDLARHALLSHPTLARVAVAGRVIGDNDFWIRILNSGLSISAADLIGGLMARAAELSGDRFRTAARDLNAFLSPVEDGEAAGVLGNLDEGCDAMLFYGLTVTDRIEVAEGMAIVPFREVQRFVNADLVEESGAGFHGWRSVGATSWRATKSRNCPFQSRFISTASRMFGRSNPSTCARPTRRPVAPSHGFATAHRPRIGPENAVQRDQHASGQMG